MGAPPHETAGCPELGGLISTRFFGGHNIELSCAAAVPSPDRLRECTSRTNRPPRRQLQRFVILHSSSYRPLIKLQLGKGPMILGLLRHGTIRKVRESPSRMLFILRSSPARSSLW